MEYYVNYHLYFFWDRCLWETCQIQLNKIHFQFLQLFYCFVYNFTLLYKLYCLDIFTKTYKLNIKVGNREKREDIRIPPFNSVPYFRSNSPTILKAIQNLSKLINPLNLCDNVTWLTLSLYLFLWDNINMTFLFLSIVTPFTTSSTSSSLETGF